MWNSCSWLINWLINQCGNGRMILLSQNIADLPALILPKRPVKQQSSRNSRLFCQSGFTLLRKITYNQPHPVVAVVTADTSPHFDIFTSSIREQRTHGSIHLYHVSAD